MRLGIPLLALLVAACSPCLAEPLAEPDDCKVDPGDWPMLAHDARHTGYTAIGVEQPYKNLWRSFNAKVCPIDAEPPERNEVVYFSNCQPVLADGVLYIGAMNGVLYAHDARTGEVKWTAQTPRQITHAACVYGPNVIVNCTDGGVYAFDRKTGEKAWTFQTGAPLYTAPVAGGGQVYVAGRDGLVYALHYKTGLEVWKAPVNDMCLCSPAYDGENVYVGTESATAYAFDARNGTQLWKTQLAGSSMRHVWPVVCENVVVFRTMPPYGSGTLFMATENLLNANADIPWAELQPKFRELLKANPSHQTFLALDKTTGVQKYVAPVGAIMRHQDTPLPPVLAPGDKLYVNFRNNNSGSFKVSSFGTKFCPDLGEMDSDTGDIVSIASPGKFKAWTIEHSLDDASAWTMAGDWIIGDHNCHPGGRAGAVNVVKDIEQNIIPRWNYDQQPYPGGWSGAETLYRKGQRVPMTVRGWNANIGMGYSPVIVVDGVIYTIHVSGSALVAIEGKAVGK